MNPAATVIIGFADALSAPEAVWSLAGAGFRVIAFARNGTRPALLKSRIAKVEFVTDPALSAKRAIADLEAIDERFAGPIWMPLDDISLWLLRDLSSRRRITASGVVGEQANIALDKRLQFEAARASGFHVPETLQLKRASDLTGEFEFPWIVKPALAASCIGDRMGRGRAHRIEDAEGLRKFATGAEIEQPMVAQPVISGVGEGVFGFALPDRVVCWSGHRRIRMMNPAGSGASACVSVMPEPETCVTTEKFIKTIRWRGMFMVELLRAMDGKLWFMELNGRAWGSMALARRMGFEYPAWTALQSIDSKFIPPTPSDRPSVVCRHLGRELMHLAFVWRGPKSGSRKDWPGRMESLRGVLRTRRGECWYNHNSSDPSIFAADTRQTLLSEFQMGNAGSRIWGRLIRPFVRWNQSRIRSSGEVVNRVGRANHILFLCYGNINRSAVAEQHLRQMVGSKVQISSCGFHAEDGRPVDPTMKSMAMEYGVNFPSWSSRTISRELVDSADLILAMEVSHLVRLFREFPSAEGRAFLLSSVIPSKAIPLEISDPFGKTPDIYKECIREVTSATSAMSEVILHSGSVS